MAYKAPGVYVKDVYTEPEIQPSSPYFWPAIVAPVRNVVENYEIPDVTYDSTADVTINLMDYVEKGLPLSIFDQIVESSVKVYLIPESGSRQGYFWNSITRKHNARFGLITDTTVKPYIDISADVVKTNLSNFKITIPDTLPNAVLVNGADFLDDSRKVTKKCSVVIEFETRKLETKLITTQITEYSRENGSNKIRLSFNLSNSYTPAEPQNNYTLKITKPGSDVETITISNENIDTTTREVVVEIASDNPSAYEIVSMELTYPIQNPIFANQITISNVRSIISNFGTIHPLNTIAYALGQALQNGAESVVALALPYASWSSINTKFERVLGLLDQNSSVYAVYFALDAGIINYITRLDSWLNKYSTSTEGSVAPKIAITGYEDYSVLGSVVDSALAAQALASRIASIEQKRLRIIPNPTAVVEYSVETDTNKTIEVVVPGHLFGAQFVAQVYKMMNEQDGRLPNDSFTLKPVKTFKRLRYPNGHVNWFTSQELNMLAEAGYWILYQRTEMDPIVVRHGLTTAERKKATSEDSIVRTVDYVMLTIRNQLENMVGNVKLSQNTIATVFYPRINELLKNMIAANIIEANSSIKTLMIDPTNKDRLLVTLSLAISYPSNIIELTVEV